MRIATAFLAGWLSVVPATSAAAGLASPAGNQCRKLPAGRRIVRLNLKPDTEVGDLVAWISSITCKQFVVAGDLGTGKKVTVVAPQLITPEEAYRLFLDALDSVALAVYPSGRFLRIIPSDSAKSSPIPVIID